MCACSRLVAAAKSPLSCTAGSVCVSTWSMACYTVGMVSTAVTAAVAAAAVWGVVSLLCFAAFLSLYQRAKTHAVFITPKSPKTARGIGDHEV